MATLVDLSQWLDRLPGQLMIQQQELQQAAEHQVERIKNRTSQGISVDLQIFPPYSPLTKKASPVNLQNTGDMMSDIHAAATENEAHIFFGSQEQATKAAIHNSGTRKIPQRYFFGASLQDREAIMSDLRASLFRRLNG